MLSILHDIRWRVAVPRIVADFLLVNVAMLMALWIAVTYQVHRGYPASMLRAAAAHYYWSVSETLLICFPIVFVLSGFYTYARGLRPRQKLFFIFYGAGFAVLIFLALNFLLFRFELIARSVLLPFCVLLPILMIVTRTAKATLDYLFWPKPSAQPLIEKDPEAVLVVGGAGYIGSILVRKLLDSGRRVRVLDNLTYGDGAIRDLLKHPEFDLIIGDCRNIQSVVGAVKGVSSIVHLAAIVGDPACEQSRETALEINFAATRMLIEIARGQGVERLVFASSCSVYGAASHLMTEKSPVKPISLYARTKVESERALLDAKSSTFHPTVLRFATVFGHSYRPRFDLVVNLLSAKAFREGVITIYNGEQWRPFIHVQDVANGIIRALEAPLHLVSGEVFNVGDSRLNYTLSGVAEKIGEIFPNTRVEHIDNSDRRNYRVSFDKIRSQLGFECSLSLQEGIAEMKSVFAQGVVMDYTDLLYHNQRYLENSGGPALSNSVDTQIMAAFADPLRELAPNAAGG